ncbi:4'-phosphopantetheinyl transferase family protein [Virgibacillus soli]|uniref:4'-phosphopantetheinyl transferase superfamily protein n=1 Tax=Paracerasibacillus soli TaxID=480284 RepID=A0ABU5CWV0_9BACI|nr:4'-phosphopantetheinyl transferase superfamily protein [Virgibacillus soli]MDY0409868.1 4'-phosphopantetheinyl transferase superfamily protein [Virgibacillus soli]
MQPIVKADEVNNIHVSITHNQDFGVAIAFPEEHPMGIDIEDVNDKNLFPLKEQMTKAEWNVYRKLNLSEIQYATMLWTAKEALSKVFKTGLMTPFFIYEIANIRQTEWSTYISNFVNFPQYKAISYLHQRSVLTIVCPKNTEINPKNESLLHDWISEREG